MTIKDNKKPVKQPEPPKKKPKPEPMYKYGVSEEELKGSDHR